MLNRNSHTTYKKVLETVAHKKLNWVGMKERKIIEDEKRNA